MFDKKIYKNTLFFTLIAFFFFIPFRLIFYRKTVVKGLKKIPRNKPFLFAPNHQNAIMDPLAVIYTSYRPMIFLARSDIFKNKAISWFLQKIKMLPVYRIRDGAEKLKLNEDVFNLSVNILENKTPMTIFPEAAHTDKRCLQPLKKGIPRLVFQAEQNNNWELDLQVVPVGIYYDDYPAFRSLLQVVYGDPVRVADFKDIYIENQAKGLNALKNAIAENIRPHIIDIKSKEHYDAYEVLRDMYAPMVSKQLGQPKFDQYNKFLADRHIIDKVSDFEKQQPEEMKTFADKVISYSNDLKKQKTTDKLLANGTAVTGVILKILLLVISVPVFIYGFIHNAIPTWLTLIPVKTTKDKQFHSTMKYIVGTFVFFIFHFLLFIVFALLTDIWWAKYIYWLSLPVSGVLAFEYIKLGRKLKADVRYLKIKNSTEIEKMKQQRQEITTKMTDILNTDNSLITN